MKSRRFHKTFQKAGCVVLGAVLLLLSFFVPVTAASSLEKTVAAAFSGRTLHTAGGDRLLSDASFLQTCAGTGNGDWIAFAMARYCVLDGRGNTLYYYDEDYASYRAALQRKLTDFYKTEGIKSGTKLTEYFRMGIALTALGGDCREILLAATVNNPTALTRLSIITLDYALISLSMLDFSVPQNAKHTPQDYVDRILALQMADGGWSLTSMLGGDADVDVTAMTLTALAPFYRTGDETVTAAVENALALLSKRQSNKGDFATYGLLNCESTAQVLTALTGLGIDPYTDSRFIKKGNTVVDGLLQYQLEDGSFTHAYVTDAQNTAATAGSYNYLATDQAAYALVALWRQQHGYNALYNMRPDSKIGFPILLKQLANAVLALIARLRSVLFSLTLS